MIIEWNDQIQDVEGPYLTKSGPVTLAQGLKSAIENCPSMEMDRIGELNEMVFKKPEIKATDLSDFIKVVKGSSLYPIFKHLLLKTLDKYDT